MLNMVRNDLSLVYMDINGTNLNFPLIPYCKRNTRTLVYIKEKGKEPFHPAKQQDVQSSHHFLANVAL